MYFEEQARINLVYVFRIFIRLLSGKEVSESEIAVHHRVKVVNFDAILVDNRFLMVAKEAGEFSYDSFARSAPSLCLALKSPMP